MFGLLLLAEKILEHKKSKKTILTMILPMLK